MRKSFGRLFSGDEPPLPTVLVHGGRHGVHERAVPTVDADFAITRALKRDSRFNAINDAIDALSDAERFALFETILRWGMLPSVDQPAVDIAAMEKTQKDVEKLKRGLGLQAPETHWTALDDPASELVALHAVLDDAAEHRNDPTDRAMKASARLTAARLAVTFFVRALERGHPYATSPKKWGSYLRGDLPELNWVDPKTKENFELTSKKRMDWAVALSESRTPGRPSAAAKIQGAMYTIIDQRGDAKNIYKMLDGHGRKSRRKNPTK